MADNILLETKFFIPRVAMGIVLRPRLIQRLQEVLHKQLTLVSAPAGYGKTTLISQWVQESHVVIKWLSLENAENDPVRFWEYFIGSLQKISQNLGKKALAFLHSSQPIPIESTLNLLINDITVVPADFVLVLDDYYFIHAEAIHQGLTYFIEHLPPVMHLVIVTRVDPPLPLARFRGKGSMLEIGTDDLRFNLDEASGLLASLMGQALAAKDLEAINARAEGWAVGLKMAALSLGKQKDIKESIAAFTGSQRYIMDYLVEEVLGHQPQDVRDFLLKTSVLARMCGPLCDAVTQGTGGRDRLLSLEKANLFLIPLDESRQWYRYHHLFAELLRHQLDLEYGKDMAYELHRKASRWYEDNNLFDEAIDHALSARDWERAMNIIGIGWASNLTLRNWLRHIPEEILRTDIERYFNHIWALTDTGEYKAAEECLKYLDTVTENNNNLQGRIAAVRAMIAVIRGDYTNAEQYARKALSLLNPDYDDRAIAYFVLGSILELQAYDLEAEPLLRQAVDIYKRAGIIQATIDPLAQLGFIAMKQVRLHEAAKLYKEAIELAGDAPSFASSAYLGLGSVYYYWNDLEASARYLEKAVEMYQLWIRGVGLEYAYLGLAKTKAVAGDIEKAIISLEDADRYISQGSLDPSIHSYNAAFHAAVALMMNDTETATRWIDNLAESDVMGLILLNPSISVLRLFWTRKGGNEVAKKVQLLREQLAQRGNRSGVLFIQILQALDSLGPESPLDCLSGALTLCKSSNAIRVFVDIGTEMVPLLKQAVSHNIEPEFARKLINIIEAEDRQRRIRKGELPPSTTSSAILSEREMEVLHLMASGLSDRQIAGKLVISLSTAKTHVHRILEKLNATSRMQAVTQAKELKLL